MSWAVWLFMVLQILINAVVMYRISLLEKKQ